MTDRTDGMTLVRPWGPFHTIRIASGPTHVLIRHGGGPRLRINLDGNLDAVGNALIAALRPVPKQ